MDPAEIEKLVDVVLSENPKQLEQYRAGKTKLQGYFAGQVWNFTSFMLIFPLFIYRLSWPVNLFLGDESIKR